jgi:DNA-binding NarL/FixJ family response regulator
VIALAQRHPCVPHVNVYVDSILLPRLSAASPMIMVSNARAVKVVVKMSLVRVLVADNFEPWRQMVCDLLEGAPDLIVVRLASNGPDLVRQAGEVQPDLIILDIELTGLNGIDGVRLIHDLCPSTKILFLSLNSEPEVVRACLDAGANGYILKTDVLGDLLAGARVVIAGKQFVSSGLVKVHRALRE